MAIFCVWCTQQISINFTKNAYGLTAADRTCGWKKISSLLCFKKPSRKNWIIIR